MSRTVSGATQAAIAQRITQPGYFVEMQFSSVVRLCSRGTIPWNGKIWPEQGFKIESLSEAAVRALRIRNTDNAIGALVLNEGVADRPVQIWKFYGNAPAAADPVSVFSGVCDYAEFDDDGAAVRIALAARGSDALFSPREFISPQTGFNTLTSAGTVITFGLDRFVLERFD